MTGRPARHPERLATVLTLAALAAARVAHAQTGENVLIVANADSRVSTEIAEYYAAKRNVPPGQVVMLSMPVAEEIARAEYSTRIERPIGAWLTAHGAQDRILYVVLTKDVPLRITGTVGRQGSVASVDSELALLYGRLYQGALPVNGPVPNPYFLGDAPIAGAKAFTHRLYDLFLVTRLDGFTVADVKGLIDRGAEPSTKGRILLDQRAEISRSVGNEWLGRAASQLRSLHGWQDRVVLDSGPGVLRGEADVLGYYSWGSNDTLNFKRRFGFQFAPGAIGATFVSTDGRTFKEPPQDWNVRDTEFAGSKQSLIGDLIREGITGVAGHVAEPYLDATIRPDILFPAYVSGMNLAESFYLAMPSLSWQTVVVGDPLTAPFRQFPPSSADLNPPLDRTTELPAFFSERRVGVAVAAGILPDASRLFVLAEGRLARNDRAGARQALEDATKQDEAFAAAHFALANLYESLEQWDAAIDRYRRILARAPNHVLALNNLAYALAEHRNEPQEALSLATRAYALGNRAAFVADTLGWVQHKLGRDAEAEPLLVDAARAIRDNAEIQLHAAIVLAAVGKRDAARGALDLAIKLDSRLGERADVKGLKASLAQPPQGARRIRIAVEDATADQP